jgi:hypothetical protein
MLQYFYNFLSLELKYKLRASIKLIFCEKESVPGDVHKLIAQTEY